MSHIPPRLQSHRQFAKHLQRLIALGEKGVSKPRLAASIVSLMAYEENQRLIDSNPLLREIVEDIAADLEICNGSVEELWDELHAAVERFALENSSTP